MKKREAVVTLRQQFFHVYFGCIFPRLSNWQRVCDSPCAILIFHNYSVYKLYIPPTKRLPEFSISYSLGRVLPGQRDGSLLWHKDLVKFLEGSSLKMAENEAYPSMLRSAKGDCLMLVHIDDILIVGSRKTVLEELIPSMQAKYTISIEIMSGPGDEVTFLKKTHQLMSDGRMIIRIHPKHLDQLCKLLHLSKRLQNKRSPGHSEIETPDTTEELNQHDASVYRSCIGILLYLSPDLPQCQYVIRYLSTCASRPTHKAMVVLKHLIGYMAGHADQYVSLKWKGMHSGLMRDYECEEPVLEIYSDADWAADRNTRRSVFWQWNLLWWMFDLLIIKNAEDSVTLER